MAGCDFANDFGGWWEVESAERHVEGMAGHVAEGSGAVVIPTAPVEWVVGILGIGARLGMAEPEIPVEFRWDWRGGGRVEDTLWPNGAVGPNMDCGGFADDAGLDEFDGAAESFEGAALVAHLSDEFFFLGEGFEFSGFADGMGEWFLAIDVFTGRESGFGDDAVEVVGGGDGDGVEA